MRSNSAVVLQRDAVGGSAEPIVSGWTLERAALSSDGFLLAQRIDMLQKVPTLATSRLARGQWLVMEGS